MPAEETTYRDGVRKDIENLKNVLELRMSTFEHDMRDSQARQELKLETIDQKVTFTNGKVRKIIMAMILLAGIVIGQVFSTPQGVIELLSHMV